MASKITATEVGSLIFVAVATVIRLHNQHLGANNIDMLKRILPPGVFRLNESVRKLRREIGRVMQAYLGNPLPIVNRYVADHIGNYHLSNESETYVMFQSYRQISKELQNQRGFYTDLTNSGRKTNLDLDYSEDWGSV